jgi:cysteine-S-conjugate beta-lyase
MPFNYDKEIDRQGTSSTKWEFLHDGDQMKYGDHADPKHGKNRLLPMWVADMDFPAPPAVIEALKARAEHGIFGYTQPTDSYYDAVIDWMARRYGYTIERDWIVLTPGVVPAINMMVQAFLAPGEKVLVQQPVYYPFFSAIENNGGKIVSNPLIYENGGYRMDFDDLAKKTADPAVTMAIFCSPHNPISRVWTAEELTRFGKICIENNVLVISDEIHCDLIYDGCKFTPFAAINDTFAQKSIVCTAPSKTFNLAGLKTSNIIISNPELRDRFTRKMLQNHIKGVNTFGIVATEAAYNHGEEWLAETMEYIQANYRFMAAYMAEHLPQLKIIPPEGTYLVWVDCRALGLDPDTRKELLMEEARLFLDEGELFGPEGEGFERFNIACPRSILEEALKRFKVVIDRL